MHLESLGNTQEAIEFSSLSTHNLIYVHYSIKVVSEVEAEIKLKTKNRNADISDILFYEVE